MAENRTVGAICAGFICVLATSVLPAMEVDSDGCFQAQHSNEPCLEYNTYENNNKTYIELRNVCSERLYMKWCADNKCGVDGLRASQTKKKYEYVTNAKVRAIAVGSRKPSKDWVCAGKINDWRNF